MRTQFFVVLSLLFLTFYACQKVSVPQKKTVLIYNGPGVSQESLKHIWLAVREVLPDYPVEYIGPSQVINDLWEEKAAVFILPGGADIPYTQELNGLGNQKIKNYVANGGAFLGICAGSYYAGAFVDFAKNTFLEVQGERELAFFPGIVKGPVLAQYDYLSQKGARAARLTWGASKGFKEGEKFTVFYNGGGYFVDAANFSNTSVLAYYDEEKKLPGIIQCRIGRGVAILSGAHVEYDPSLLDPNDVYLKTVIPLISEDNQHRKFLLKHLFERLLSKDVARNQ
jgi:glutamine amidotransferase-like uncharacterized protein